MKTMKLVHGVACAAALGAGVLGMAACGGGGGSDASQVKQRTEQAFKAAQKEDWKAVHKLVSPRSGCTQGDIEDFFGGAAELTGVDTSKSGLRDVRVAVDEDGRSATATYMTTYDGRDASRQSDEWEKVEGTWYLALDGAFFCSGEPEDESGDRSGAEYEEGSDEAAIEKRMGDVFDAMRDEDWGKLHSLISERAREDCSKAEFIASQEDTSDLPEGFDFSKVGYRDLEITVSGERARANFTVTYDGEPGDSITELWVKSDGTWYDDDSTDNAGYNGCGEEQEARSVATTARTTPTRAAATVAARTATPVRTATPARTPTARATVANTTADQKAISSAFEAQFLALRAKSWAKVYATLSPRSRADCTAEEFGTAIADAYAAAGFDPASAGYSGMVITVRGNTATLRYQVSRPSGTSEVGATWVKVDGVWYDDNDGRGACVFG